MSLPPRLYKRVEKDRRLLSAISLIKMCVLQCKLLASMLVSDQATQKCNFLSQDNWEDIKKKKKIVQVA